MSVINLYSPKQVPSSLCLSLLFCKPGPSNLAKLGEYWKRGWIGGKSLGKCNIDTGFPRNRTYLLCGPTTQNRNLALASTSFSKPIKPGFKQTEPKPPGAKIHFIWNKSQRPPYHSKSLFSRALLPGCWVPPGSPAGDGRAWKGRESWSTEEKPSTCCLPMSTSVQQKHKAWSWIRTTWAPSFSALKPPLSNPDVS